jgi:hypothetical protein
MIRGFSEPRDGMDHRVKPGGDDVSCLQNLGRETRRENDGVYPPPWSVAQRGSGTALRSSVVEGACSG